MVSVKREQKIFFFKVPFNFLIYNDSLYFAFKGKIDLNLSIKMKQWSKQHLFLALAPLVRPALNQAHVPSLVLLITILVTHLTALICAQVWAFFFFFFFSFSTIIGYTQNTELVYQTVLLMNTSTYLRTLKLTHF